MDRIFHARTGWADYSLLLLLTIVTVWGMWDKHVLIALFGLVVLAIVIERIIHTTYTVTTDGRLLISTGRFTGRTEVQIPEITSIEPLSSMRVGRWAASRYLLIHYGGSKHVALKPDKEEEFIHTLHKYTNKT